MSNDPDRLFQPGGYYGQRQLSVRELHQAARDARAARRGLNATGDFLDCEAGRIMDPSAPSIGARISAGVQSIPNSTITAVAFLAPGALPQFDSGNFFSAATPTLITFPVTGRYLIGVEVSWDVPAAIGLYVTVLHGSSSGDFGLVTAYFDPAYKVLGGLNYEPLQCTSAFIPQAAGDTLTVRIGHNSGAPLNLLNAFLWAYLVG